MINGIKIQQIEGAEILKNNLENRKIKKEYKAVMPNSKLLDKLFECGLYLNKNKDKTQDIIQVTFNYGYTDKECRNMQKKINKNKVKISENVDTKKTKLAERKLQSSNKNKAPYTESVNNLCIENKMLREDIKSLSAKIKEDKMNVDKVRDYLYNNGFKIDCYKYDKKLDTWKVDKTINYVYWFRTTSKSRVGDTLFINKKLLTKKFDSWQNMGIELPKEGAKVVENEAYKGLTASSISEGYIRIEPKNILVVNDLESWSNKLCCRVYTKPDGSCAVENKKMDIKNILFDGMALVEDSIFTSDNGMVTLRHHYFKCCGFRSFIKKYMMDYFGDKYETATVKNRYGNDIKISEILMITTENAMKWEKLGKTYDEWCQAVIDDDCQFAICKVDHPSKYKGYQRMSYQMIQTLPNIDTNNVKNLCASTIQYIDSLKSNLNSFIDFLDMNKCEINANQMYIDLIKNNPTFKDSDIFCKFRSKTISDYKKTLRTGKLLQNADNLTVCGNPYLLLQHSVGALNEYITGNIIEGYTDPTLPILESGISVYTTRFGSNEELAAFRNPHNAPNNCMYFVNYRDENSLLDTYFNFSKNIIAVNMVKTDAQDRANGMDEDSDFVYCTNQKLIVESSISAQKFPTIVNDIPKSDKTYNNTMSDRAKIDSGLAKGKYDIGLTSNIAQLSLSWYWRTKTKFDRIASRNYSIKNIRKQSYKGKINLNNNIKVTKNSIKDLAEIVAIMSVLAQCAIDNSKRTYKVLIPKEIARIRNLPCMIVKTAEGKTAKPYFWQFIRDCKIGNKKLSYYDLALEQLADKYKLSIKKYKLLKYNKDEVKGLVIDFKANSKPIDRHLKLKSALENADRQKEKEDDIVKHCINEKICPMDFIQEEIDCIKDAWSNDKCKDNLSFVEKIKGKSETKQFKKLTAIISEFDNWYKTNKADKDNNIVNEYEEDEKWITEQKIKVDDTLKELKKYTPTIKTMQMLILSAFEGNRHYKQRLLNCLYNLDSQRFLECFKKNV